jgi:alkylated DNA repair dioxygenase AlkB
MSVETDQLRLQDPNQDPNPETPRPVVRKKKKRTSNIIGLDGKIGQGDSLLCLNLLDRTEAEQAFYCSKEDVRWQRMFHRSGEVPRLVAVQGRVSKDGTVPIYRHPADESPELLPFDAVVNMLARAAEKLVGHPLNHALIQWYRNSEDNISEHSDKTLDIVRGSSIVNISVGAQRTMILRTKKSALPATDGANADAPRPSQRVPLPHNSIFILGQQTNQHWLHSIRADKRLLAEKTAAELAYEGERISFTFRQIGTFINLSDNTIWGQGATGKTREEAKPLLTGSDAEREGETMIRAFGQENHRSVNWDWDEWYGKGFDVVNFQTRPVSAEDENFTTLLKQGDPSAEKPEVDGLYEESTPAAGPSTVPF